ncbi:hypothetical protein, partial [Herbaspirillum sp. RV1423]|uniref:hypothetical protein n=1 Tax=Herbaspirillum sp. RV1423 TaxID=1443993 RepID=UPI001E3EFBF6
MPFVLLTTHTGSDSSPFFSIVDCKFDPITPGTKITGMIRSGTLWHMAMLSSGGEVTEWYSTTPLL